MNSSSLIRSYLNNQEDMTFQLLNIINQTANIVKSVHTPETSKEDSNEKYIPHLSFLEKEDRRVIEFSPIYHSEEGKNISSEAGFKISEYEKLKTIYTDFDEKMKCLINNTVNEDNEIEKSVCCENKRCEVSPVKINNTKSSFDPHLQSLPNIQTMNLEPLNKSKTFCNSESFNLPSQGILYSNHFVNDSTSHFKNSLPNGQADTKADCEDSDSESVIFLYESSNPCSTELPDNNINTQCENKIHSQEDNGVKFFKHSEQTDKSIIDTHEIAEHFYSKINPNIIPEDIQSSSSRVVDVYAKNSIDKLPPLSAVLSNNHLATKYSDTGDKQSCSENFNLPSKDMLYSNQLVNDSTNHFQNSLLSVPVCTEADCEDSDSDSVIFVYESSPLCSSILPDKIVNAAYENNNLSHNDNRAKCSKYSDQTDKSVVNTHKIPDHFRSNISQNIVPEAIQKSSNCFNVHANNSIDKLPTLPELLSYKHMVLKYSDTGDKHSCLEASMLQKNCESVSVDASTSIPKENFTHVKNKRKMSTEIPINHEANISDIGIIQSELNTNKQCEPKAIHNSSSCFNIHVNNSEDRLPTLLQRLSYKHMAEKYSDTGGKHSCSEAPVLQKDCESVSASSSTPQGSFTYVKNKKKISMNHVTNISDTGTFKGELETNKLCVPEAIQNSSNCLNVHANSIDKLPTLLELLNYKHMAAKYSDTGGNHSFTESSVIQNCESVSVDASISVPKGNFAYVKNNKKISTEISINHEKNISELAMNKQCVVNAVSDERTLNKNTKPTEITVPELRNIIQTAQNLVSEKKSVDIQNTARQSEISDIAGITKASYIENGSGFQNKIPFSCPDNRTDYTRMGKTLRRNDGENLKKWICYREGESFKSALELENVQTGYAERLMFNIESKEKTNLGLHSFKELSPAPKSVCNFVVQQEKYDKSCSHFTNSFNNETVSHLPKNLKRSSSETVALPPNTESKEVKLESKKLKLNKRNGKFRTHKNTIPDQPLFIPDKVLKSIPKSTIDDTPEKSTDCNTNRCYGKRVTNRGKFLTEEIVNTPPKVKKGRRNNISAKSEFTARVDEFHAMTQSPEIDISFQKNFARMKGK